MKKRIFVIAVMVLILTLSSCGGGNQEEVNKAQAELSAAQETITELEAKVSTAQKEADELKSELDSAKTKLESKNAEYEKLKQEYDAYKEEMAKAAEEAAEKERKEKQGYDTGITYDQLEQTSLRYLGEKVTFKGEVVAVEEGSDKVTVGLAVDGNDNNGLYCAYDPSIVSSRVLEGDTITVYGIFIGLVSGESTTGRTESFPAVCVEKIDQ